MTADSPWNHVTVVPAAGGGAIALVGGSKAGSCPGRGHPSKAPSFWAFAAVRLP